MNRRDFLLSTTVAAATALSARFTLAQSTRPATASATKPSTIPADVVWRNVRDWGVEGRGFDDTANYFDRLPGRAKGVVRDDVWNRSRNSTGMSVRFETDSPAIYVRYTLLKEELAMAHMPATGVSGVDLYGRHEGGWRYVSTVQPKSRTVESPVHDRLEPVRRAYAMHLPLYNGVTSFEIGMGKSASFAPVAPRADKPILFYGTSITQGGCASRPGMSFVSILGRTLDRPMLNFGFSGNGRTEIEVARFLAELDPAVFVIDTIANTSPDQIAERMVPLVKVIREKHPKTPVLLLDERKWDNMALVPYLSGYHKEKSDALRKAYEALQHDGVPNVHHRAGDDLLGADGEATVDGSHPNDLGMMRYADALAPDLRRLIGTT